MAENCFVNELYLNGYLSYEDDMFFLRKYREYDCEHKRNIEFSYENKKLEELSRFLPKEMFEYSQNNDFTFMVKIMIWVHMNLNSNGMVTPVRPFNCIHILEQTQTRKIGSNCWMHAVVLNEILLSFGCKSRVVRCMPLDLRFTDCHCVVHVFSKELEKWILLDPAFGTYYMDRNRRPINLMEFRRAMVNNEKIICSFIPLRRAEGILRYWIKNLIRFESYSKSAFNIESTNSDKIVYSLVPSGFCLCDKTINVNEYSVKIIHTENETEFWEG